MAKNYYETLGVSKDATQDEIKSQYRKLVKQYHPDLHPNDPECANKFKEINEANEVLSDPQKRRQYDYEQEHPNMGGFGGFGGAFKNKSVEELKNVTAKDALKHPTWQMGQKITIDCATMMNKAFEVIEAMWLFDTSIEKIDVVIHQESIIHSMVEFEDSAIIAQMGNPSMEVPIQLALTYPERFNSDVEPLNLIGKV